MEDALAHLNRAHALDQKHNSSEVWRELGATNLELGHTELALQQLETYVQRREYDPQGLFWLGRAHKALGHIAEARTAWERAIEAAKTSPPHLRRQNATWGRQAAGELRRK